MPIALMAGVLLIGGYAWGLFGGQVPALAYPWDRPSAMSLLADVASCVFVAGFLRLMWLRFDLRTSRRPLVYSTSLAAVALTIGALPFFLVLLDKVGGGYVFDPGCRSGQLDQFFWLAVDSIAKGALVEILDVFNINLFICGPQKPSLMASSTILGIRALATYLVVVVVLQKLAQVRFRKALDVVG